jgi:signal transduction histidine kinase/DNA-binding response OmpR family regulator/ligand-binding sensor domain-containing protein
MLLLALFLPAAVYTQKIGTKGAFMSETAEYAVEEVRLPGGQPGNNVTSVVQGPNGFMWFGTHKGLHRYDGHEFITYKEREEGATTDGPSLDFSYVENLFWDSREILWICTYGGGLFAFDPVRESFKRYQHDPNDPHSISQDRVMSAAEDREGNLWFGTEQKGLNRLDLATGKFARYSYKKGDSTSLSHNTVKNIYLDHQGTLWIATGAVPWMPYAGGLNRYVPEADHFVRYLYDQEDPNSLWTNAVQGLLEDRRGNFWVTTTAGLLKMDRTAGTFERMLYSPNRPHAPGADVSKRPGPFSLLEDRKGGLWVGTVDGGDNPYHHLLRYDPATQSVLNLPVPGDAWELCESKDGTIWVAGGTLVKITPVVNAPDLTKGEIAFEAFKKTALYEELSAGKLEEVWFQPITIAFDFKNGNAWTKNIYGVRINQDTLYFPILVNRNEANGNFQFHHLEDFNLTEMGGLFSGEFFSEWDVPCLAVDKEGKVWGSYFSGEVGLFCFDPKQGTTTNYLHHAEEENSPWSNYFSTMTMDQEGKIWIGHLENSGISCFDPASEKWKRYRLDRNEEQVHLPLAIAAKEDGSIWIGGATAAIEPFLAAIHPDTDSVRHYKLPESIATYIRALAVREEKVVFAWNDFGLGVLQLDQPDGTIRLYNLDENNFPINNIAGMAFDKDAALWVAALEDGLYARIDLEKERWELYNTKEGWPVMGRRTTAGPDGNIYLSTYNSSWVKIDPRQVPYTVEEVEAALVDLYINGERQIAGEHKALPKPIWRLNRLDIAQREMPIGFRFSGFHFRSTRTVYHYRLYPYEKNWKTVEDEAFVNYSYLPAGSYQLQVKAYTNNGSLDTDGIQLAVVIHPSWWKSWWAYTLYSLLLLALLAGLLLYQRRRLRLQATLQIERERAERLKELDQFKSRFYTNITHEFRTPLTVIQGMARQIEGQDKIRQLIERNSQRLLNMVSQLLDLSRLENNSLALKWIQGDVIPYLTYLTESCHSLADQKKINLAFFAKVDKLVMDFDEEKLQHILINLISNAIKFTPEYGSVKVVAGQQVENGQPYLEVAVSDTGRGIPQSKLPHIFDRFYQVDDSTTRHSEGSGVGLALVKELVLLMNGCIEVESESGKGTVFTVRLPVRNEAEQVPIQADSRPTGGAEKEEGISREASGLETTHLPLVLIIEDNADVTEYINSCLRGKYALLNARNGKEGIAIARKEVPDVILSDVMMPEMDGFEVCHQLKSELVTSHIPVVLLTAKATQEDKVAGLSSGADAYLTKPFDKEELLIRLENLTAISRRLRERLHHPTEPPAGASLQDQKEASFLKELHRIIHENMEDESFDTHHLCRAIAMSRTQLHRKLKALTGQPTASFIRSIRLQHAKKLITTTDWPIGDIASKTGYKDFSHFSRSFAKEFGYSPSDLRKA